MDERKALVRENPIRALAKAVLVLEQLADAREATPRQLAELLERAAHDRLPAARQPRGARPRRAGGSARHVPARLEADAPRRRRHRAARRAPGRAARDGADPRGDRRDRVPARPPRRRRGVHRAARGPARAVARASPRRLAAAPRRGRPARAARVGAARGLGDLRRGAAGVRGPDGPGAAHPRRALRGARPDARAGLRGQRRGRDGGHRLARRAGLRLHRRDPGRPLGRRHEAARARRRPRRGSSSCS